MSFKITTYSAGNTSIINLSQFCLKTITDLILTEKIVKRSKKVWNVLLSKILDIYKLIDSERVVSNNDNNSIFISEDKTALS